MAFIHGKDSGVFLAEFDLSAYLTAVDVGQEVATHDVTTISKSSVARFSGLFDGSASLTGLFDAAYDDDVYGYVGTAAGEPFTLAFGSAVGDRVRCGLTKTAKYASSAPVGGMVTASASLESDGGMWAGELLHPSGAEVATGNGTTVDTGLTPTWVGVNQGGVGVLHLTAVTALTTLDVKIQDSTDGAAWADLASFTQLTAVGSEKIEVALGTQVDRYLRAVWTLVGTSVTFTVSFARWAHSA